jgi:hypothetical protein
MRGSSCSREVLSFHSLNTSFAATTVHVPAWWRPRGYTGKVPAERGHAAGAALDRELEFTYHLDTAIVIVVCVCEKALMIDDEEK